MSTERPEAAAHPAVRSPCACANTASNATGRRIRELPVTAQALL